jgi:hypothetical protein
MRVKAGHATKGRAMPSRSWSPDRQG